ncbi:glycosyltransferase family 1 protein, partial [Enterobacter hormaechei]|nr:glycosyltransferase family 1 protein [Enterobacter hormaechei]
MKVILNTESVRFPLTGIGRYTYELAKALQKQEALASLRFFAAGQFVSLPEEADCNAAPMLARGKLANLKAVLQKSSMFMEVYRNLAEVVRSNGLKGHQGCIYHGPNFFLPQFDGPSVATFHDLSPFTWANCHEPAKVRYMQKE